MAAAAGAHRIAVDAAPRLDLGPPAALDRPPGGQGGAAPAELGRVGGAGGAAPGTLLGPAGGASPARGDRAPLVQDRLRQDEAWPVDEALERSAPEGMGLAMRVRTPDVVAMTSGIIVPVDRAVLVEVGARRGSAAGGARHARSGGP